MMQLPETSVERSVMRVAQAFLPFLKTQSRKLKATRGFTLIEMLVAVGIFMFVMVVAVGSLVAMVGADRKAQSIEAVVDNLRFALDDMSRTIRTGTEFNCSTNGSVSGVANCINGGNQIAVIDQYGHLLKVVYQYSTAAQCGTGYSGGCIRRSTDGGAIFLPITSPEVQIDVMAFYLVDNGPRNGLQPEVVMTLSAHISAGLKQSTVLHLQTTVTQRNFDS